MSIEDSVDLSLLSADARPRFHVGHGAAVRAEGVAMSKVAPTWVVPIRVPFEVVTNEGVLTAEAGDFLAYDERSGHVWPVAAQYVALNYQPVAQGSQAPAAPSPAATHALYAAFEALESAARHLSAQDVAMAESLCAHEATYRPLTQLCGEAAAGLRDYIAEQIGLVTGDNVGLGHDAPVTSLRPVPETPQ